MKYPHLILERVLNTPLLITPTKLEIISAVLGLTPSITLPEKPKSMAPGIYQPNDKPYAITPQGIAIVPILGTLVQRMSFMDADCGLISYEKIKHSFSLALEDPKIKGILLEIDSPGGEVSGCFDLVDQIYQARKIKPVWAMANESAYSAGYALASAAEKIFLARTGGVGSIGVVLTHRDQSKANENAGLFYTSIFAGKHKNDFSPHCVLPEEQKQTLQEHVNSTYDLFISTVARNRGIDKKAVRDTEAALYQGQAAIDAGLADQLATFEQVINSMGKQILGDLRVSKETLETEAKAPVKEAAPVIDLEKVKLEAKQGEKTRINAILTAPEAKGKEALARTLALDTGLTQGEAIKVLGNTPASVPVTNNLPDPLAVAMDQVENPDVTPAQNSSPEKSEAEEVAKLAAEISSSC